MADSPIPLVDLAVQHRQVEAAVEEGFEKVVRAGSFILGSEVSEFEKLFSHYCDAGHCVGVANGTDALELSLRAVGVEPGSRVVMPANSYVATAEAIVRAGAIPALVDCDLEHFLIDTDQALSSVGPSTSAIVPVHLYGQMADVERLQAKAEAYGTAIVEDAAQCQGARRNGRAPASLTGVAATSFYPGKNLGAYGDAGAVITNDSLVASRLRRLRNHGGEHRYEHTEVGFNSRMDTLQAVVLAAKLKHLDRWNDERRRAANIYDALLCEIEEIERPSTLEGNDHVWHLYVVRAPFRDRIIEHLQREGIGAGIHYPVPVHLLPAFSYLGYKRGDFPVAERAADEILSLPLFPGITMEQQERVVIEIKRALA